MPSIHVKDMQREGKRTLHPPHSSTAGGEIFQGKEVIRLSWRWQITGFLMMLKIFRLLSLSCVCSSEDEVVFLMRGVLIPSGIRGSVDSARVREGTSEATQRHTGSNPPKGLGEAEDSKKKGSPTGWVGKLALLGKSSLCTPGYRLEWFGKFKFEQGGKEAVRM